MSYNSLVVGVLIEKEEFFTEVSIGVQCERGHKPPEGNPRYCALCGGHFENRTKEILTELGKRFADRYKLVAPAWPVRRLRAYEFERSGFFHHVMDGEGDGTHLAVLGENVDTEYDAEVYHKTVLCVLPESIAETRKSVGSKLADLGLGGRDVKVYWF